MPASFVMRSCVFLGLGAVGLFSHATWIAPVAEPLQVGKSVNVQIGNGHAFPGSEAALSTETLKMFAVAPSGARTDLKPVAAGHYLTAGYQINEPGTYRFVMVNDRGIVSRTPQGLKPGGRDKNPGAVQAMKMYRAAIAYTGTPGSRIAGSKPVGLAFEMLPDRTADSISLTVLLDSKPCPGAQIRAVWPGGKEEELGESSSGGKFTYRVPGGKAGPFLLIAARSEKTTGQEFDTRDYSTALHLTW